ncbi:MAG: hypothetical protein U0S76_06740 [Pseudoxanthomonas sp.]|nr:hypothetical protein [Pseudoxanthomonas sp.]
MLIKSLSRGLAAFGALFALSAGMAQASMRISEAIDGNWFDPTRERRGVDFDFIPTGEGRGVLFMTLFTFDQAGNPLWITGNSSELGEFEYETSFPIGRITGGSFGPGGNPVPAVLGSISVNFASCSQANVTLTMDAASGLPNTTYNLQPLQSTLRSECVWRQAFSACPAGTTQTAPRTCKLEGNYFGQNLRLTNNTIWELGDLVLIGDDNAQQSTITIEPGTRIFGDARESALYINRGSKIFAEARRNAPIIFTSFQDGVAGGTPATGDWGGLIISGNAPVNCANNTCDSEFSGLYGRPLLFGGTNATESSGVLRYIQVRYAGVVYQPNREVNSFTLQGVGSGTVLEYLQSYRGQDDDIEFFGGTANVKYFVGVDGGDDFLDWDLGYSGKIQFALLQQGAGFGENHGNEGANSPTNFDATPRAIPVLSNVTYIGNPASPNTNDGLQFKEGSGGKQWNSYVTGFTRSCLRIQQPQTGAQVAAGNLVVRNTRLNCTNNFSTSDAGGADAATFFAAQPGNSTGNGGLVNGFLPGTGSPLKGAGAVVDDPFFTPVDYIGAFRDADDDWTAGWTYGVRRN